MRCIRALAAMVSALACLAVGTDSAHVFSCSWAAFGMPANLSPWHSRVLRTLGSRSSVAPLRTSHPSGSRLARLAVRSPWLRLQPQKTLCSPPRPIHAAGHAGRTGLWLRASAIQPLVAHGAGATNSLPRRDRHAACNQVSWLYQPHSDTAAAVPLIVQLLIRTPAIPQRACHPS